MFINSIQYASASDVSRAWERIQTAEADLGPLSRGQRRDLLKDNMPWHSDRCDMAEALVEMHYPAGGGIPIA